MEKRYRLYILLVLTLVGGFCDSSAFVMQGIFTGHITGNTVLAAVYLMQEKWNMSGYCILALCFFLSGTYIGNLFRLHNQKKTLYHLVIPLLLQQTVLIVIGSILWVTKHHAAFTFLLTLAMGLQNGVITPLNNITLHSTYITGMATSLLKSLTSSSCHDDKELQKLIISEILLFITGACLGGYLSSHFSIKGFLTVFFPLFVAGILSLFAHRKTENIN